MTTQSFLLFREATAQSVNTVHRHGKNRTGNGNRECERAYETCFYKKKEKKRKNSAKKVR